MKNNNFLGKKHKYTNNMDKANKIIKIPENKAQAEYYRDYSYGEVEKNNKPENEIQQKVVERIFSNPVKVEKSQKHSQLPKMKKGLSQVQNAKPVLLNLNSNHRNLQKSLHNNNIQTISKVHNLQTVPKTNLSTLNQSETNFSQLSKYNSKFYYIIFGVMVLVVSSFLTMLFTVNGGIQNGFHDYALDLTDGSVQSYTVQQLVENNDTYNVEGNIQDFKTNYKRILSAALNWNLLLNNNSSNHYLLSSVDFNIDWSDVDWEHTGYYNITISSNNKFLKGETKSTIVITNYDTVDLNTLDMIALKTTPYVTTDPTAETQNLEDEALQIIKNNSSDPESITADDFNITFSNQNSFSPESGLDLTNDQIVNTMTISTNGNNNLIKGSQDISIRPQPYDLSSEDMFYESPHSAYTSMGSELSGHMMSDEPHNFNTMYLDIHDVSEQYATSTDYIWQQEGISLVHSIDQMLTSYAYSWTQNDTGSWTAEVSHNDFLGSPNIWFNMDTWRNPNGPSKFNAGYDDFLYSTKGSGWSNVSLRSNRKSESLDNHAYLPKDKKVEIIPKEGGREPIPTARSNKSIPSQRTKLPTERLEEFEETIESNPFMEGELEDLIETNALSEVSGESSFISATELEFGEASEGSVLETVNFAAIEEFEETVAEEIASEAATSAAEGIEAISEAVTAGEEISAEAVERALVEAGAEAAETAVEAAASSFGTDVATTVAEFFAEFGAIISGVIQIALLVASIIFIIMGFIDDDTMMLPNKISTLANKDLNNKFNDISNAPVEYGGIPDLPMPTDTNGNVTSWTSIVTSTMTDSTVIEDWNWCPPNGTWEDRFMSWYGYSIVAKPDNGVVTGSANMHIKFYSTSASD